MSDEENGGFGSADTLKRLWEFLRNQVTLLENARVSIKDRRESRWLSTLPLLYAVGDTCKSILLLAREQRLRDTFVLSRTAYETILNTCFILAVGDDAADRAYRHPLQRAWRDLDRKLVVGDTTLYLKHTETPSPNTNDRIQKVIDEFTSKRGREITQWTPEKLTERICTVGEKYGKKVSLALQFGLLAIYRHASEISHGTLFGAMYSIGVTRPAGPPATPTELVQHQRELLCMLVTLLGGAIDALLQILGIEFGETSFAAQSREAVAALRTEKWVEEEESAS